MEKLTLQKFEEAAEKVKEVILYTASISAHSLATKYI